MNKHSLMYALELLSNIAEQYCYYPLNEGLKSQVTDFLIEKLDINNYDNVDIILFIVVNMKLNDVMDKMLEKQQEASSGIRKMIIEGKQELIDPFVF